ncbi:MAG: lamin tail domain-containing protein [Verrucomicrobiaceae bacterium]
MRSIFLTSFLLAGTALGQLLVDFNRAGFNDLETGYQAYTAEHENIPGFTTQAFNAFGTTINLTPGWPDSTDPRVQQMIDRGTNNDNNWVGNKISLLTDFIGVDTRTGNGGNGNYDGSTGSPTRMTLNLSGLPAGDYQWLSYHHDTENVHTSFRIEYSTDGGSNYTLLPATYPGTNSTAGGNPASSQIYTGTPDPDPADLPSTAVFNFSASAGQDVLIRFTPYSNTGVHRQIWACNGFEITQNSAPTVENSAATDIMPTTASIGGNVTAGGSPNITLYWGDNDGGTTPGNWDTAINLGPQSASFSAAISSLTQGTTYYHRAFASNAAGSAWAPNTNSFTTSAGASLPSLITFGATEISYTQADVNGTVSNTGGDPPQVTLFYGTTNGGNDENAWDFSTGIGTHSGPFSDTLFNLDHSTTYFFRFQGTNSGGTAWAPNIQSFTTLAFTAPAVSVLPPTSAGGTSAIVNGEVTDTGNDAPEITIFYGTSDAGTNAASWQNSVAIGPKSSTFSASLLNLTPSTTYFYRVRGINSVATAWSASAETFSTGIPSDIVINEFLAGNDTIAVPNAVAGTFDDFIELLNTGSSQLNLGGWHLTDNPSNLTQWTFPANTLVEVGEFLVILANGSGVPDANGNLTTNFRLSTSGDYLALVRPNLSIASEFGPGGSNFPEQNDDVSYGLHPSSSASVFFSTPTPGALNDAGGIAKVSPVAASPGRGYYDTAQSVTLSSPTLGAQIYYTTDGSAPITSGGTPGASATLYSGPISIPQITVLRASALKANFAPAQSVTHSYVLLDIAGAGSNGTDPNGLNDVFLTQTQPSGYGALASGDYNMDPDISRATSSSTGHGKTVAQAMLEGMRDIPTISIALPKEDFAGGNGIYSNSQSEGLAWERECSAEFIPAANDTRTGFQENCGLRVQGGASRVPAKSPKHSLSFRFRNSYGEGKLRHALFPGSDVTTFNSIALRAGYNNSWIHSSSDQPPRGSMIRDQWMRESMKDMGHPDAGEGFLAHVFVNGLYWGLHNIAERQDNTHYAEHNGGDSDNIDALNGTKFVNGTTTSWNQLKTTVAGGNWNAIQQVLDVDTYIDYHLLQRFGANQDLKTNGNWRAAGGGSESLPWKLFSWDGERVLESPTASNVPLDPMGIRGNIEALPEYRLRFADRARMHLTGNGALTPTATAARWMKYANNIDKAIIAESARWGDHRRPTNPYDRNGEWLTEQNRLLTQYFPVRTTNVINKLISDGLYSPVAPPAFTVDNAASNGGFVGSGVSLSATGGKVYYTTDGSDPALANGSINPGSSSFTNPGGSPTPLNLTASTIITARILSGGDWSAPIQTAFLTEPPASSSSLAITEINYHPREATLVEKAAAAPLDLDNRDLFEFIEIQNIAAEPLNLYGAQFSAGINLTFGLEKLDPGERALIVRDLDAFTARYGTPTVKIVGTYANNLDNDGELLSLSKEDLSPIASLTFNDNGPWPSRPDGDGSTLEIIDPAQDPNDPANWRSSRAFHGTPGSAPLPDTQRIVINEVLSNPVDNLDRIELHNPTASPITISHWVITDSKGTYRSYTFPTTTIPALGYLTIDQSTFDSSSITPISNYTGNSGFFPTAVTSTGHGLTTGDIITISGYGGFSDFNKTFEVTVVNADVFQITAPFLDNDALKGGFSLGRPFGLSAGNGDDLWLVEADSSGNLISFVDHVEFAASRYGESLGRWPNAGGSDIITTMVTNTFDGDNSGPLIGPAFISEVHYQPNGADNLEFVELCNPTSSPLALENWKLRGGLDFNFTSAHTIPAASAVVIVTFDPATNTTADTAFRTHFGIDSSVTLIGPATDGPLDNLSGTVRLQAPNGPPSGNPPAYPQVTADSVDYLATSPWPSVAANGSSLQRNAPLDFGNFATSWTSAAANPGNKTLTYAAFAAALGLGAELDDDDRDGSANLIEFATGSNPLDSQSLPLQINSGGTLSFNRNLLSGSINLILQSSPDLDTWSTVTPVTGPVTNSLELNSLAFDPNNESRRFWRLRATTP